MTTGNVKPGEEVISNERKRIKISVSQTTMLC